MERWTWKMIGLVVDVRKMCCVIKRLFPCCQGNNFRDPVVVWPMIVSSWLSVENVYRDGVSTAGHLRSSRACFHFGCQGLRRHVHGQGSRQSRPWASFRTNTILSKWRERDGKMVRGRAFGVKSESDVPWRTCSGATPFSVVKRSHRSGCILMCQVWPHSPRRNAWALPIMCPCCWRFISYACTIMTGDSLIDTVF